MLGKEPFFYLTRRGVCEEGEGGAKKEDERTCLPLRPSLALLLLLDRRLRQQLRGALWPSCALPVAASIVREGE